LGKKPGVIACNFEKVRRILCLGAHSDDIEIGCGGSVLQLTAQAANLEFYWIVFSSSPERAAEAHRSAAAFLRRAREKTVIVKSFRDGFLPYEGVAVKECFEELKGTFEPDLIFTHFGHDLHQDHRLVCDLTWNTFRHHLILEYEIPKFDADLRSPNFFVPLSASNCRKKSRLLLRHFPTQRRKPWFSEDLFQGLMRLRAVEAGSPTRFAEGFHCRKMLLGNIR
jgi:LmbE family N-acetylglucosaminyl deacetylase